MASKQANDSAPMRGMQKSLLEKPTIQEPRKLRRDSKCITWTGYRGSGGYATIIITRKRKAKAHMVHRIIYEATIGKIPCGLEIDHLCRNRACVNPVHMRVVTSRENTLCGMSPSAINARKTHCIRGHALTGDNLYVRPNGKRNCMICRRLKFNQWYSENRAKRI